MTLRARRRSSTLPLSAILGTAMVALAIAAAAQAADEALPPFELEGGNRGLWRHTGTYPGFHIAWSVDRRLPGATVLAVFPHPVVARRVALATAAGLLLSDDSGGTWKPLPQASAQALGTVRHVEFHPASPDTFYLATEARGVWATEDGGQSFQQIGSKARGMAADATVGVHLYPADRRLLTLFAAHGGAATGASVSEDGGRTWRVIAGDLFVRGILVGATGEMGLYAAASKKQSPEATSIYAASSVGEPWYELLRDVIPTGFAVAVQRGPRAVSTADAGMYVLTHGGAGYSRIGPEDLARWASVGFTWGATADEQLLYAYEPTKLGLVVSTDELKTFAAHSRGLFTGPFVREGAHIRASAGGGVFFAVINGALYRGVRLGGELNVMDVAVEPASVSFAHNSLQEAHRRIRGSLEPMIKARYVAGEARAMLEFARDARAALSEGEVQVTARVTGPAKPRQVTVDLSRLGRSTRTPMLDDGRSGDGAAGDGVFGVRFPFDPATMVPPDGRDWRRSWPGRMPLTVTAVAPDGKLAGGVGVLYVHVRAEAFPWVDEFRYWHPSSPVGIVSHQGTDDTARTTHAWSAVRLTVGPGPWTVSMGNDYQRRDVTGYYALAFWVKAAPAGAADLRVQIRDNPDYLPPTPSDAVAVAREGLVEGGGITGDYRRVVVPMARLLRHAPQFQSQLLSYVTLSGDAPKQTTYWIDDIRFFLNKEELEADKKRSY